MPDGSIQKQPISPASEQHAMSELFKIKTGKIRDIMAIAWLIIQGGSGWE